MDKKLFLELLKTFESKQKSQNEGECIFEIQNVTKNYYKFFKKYNVLNIENFKLYKNNRVALLGKNGSGKTTFIEIISGITKPNSGKLTYNYFFEKFPQEKIGIQFQNYSCPAGLKVIDIIVFFVNSNKLKISQKHLLELTDKFDITKLLNEKASKISGGQQQRLNIVIAVLNNPQILLLDEISTGLDIKGQVESVNYIDSYLKSSNASLIFSSHNYEEIINLGNRVVILKSGKIVFDASLEEIKAHFKDLKFFLNNYSLI